jgi:hypothetical protein
MGARKFTFAYDQSGAHMHETHSYPIDPTTNIGKAGTVVVLTNGKVAKAAKTAQAAILGITAQDHDGSSDGQKTSFI